MGISLQQYRARIGLHTGNDGAAATSECSATHGLKLGKHVVLVCLLLLLLIAGVEPNPGPHPCKLCPKVFGTVEAYFSHQKESHLNVPCLYEDCQFETASCSNYLVHCSRSHDKDRSNIYPDVKCPVPQCKVPPRKNIKDHLEEHLDLNHSFKCPFSETCKIIHSKKKSFRTHLSQVHPLQQVTQPEAPRERNVQQVASQSQTLVAESVPNEFPPNKVKQEVAKFYLALEGEKILPSLSVQFISESIAFFLEMSHHCLQRALGSELSASGLSQLLIDKVLRRVFFVDPVFNVHHKNRDPDQVSTIHLRKQLLQKYFAYVPSIEIQLASGRGQKNKVVQYVPLRESLEMVFRDPKVRNEVLQSFTRGAANELNEILEDFRDGSAFKDHLSRNGNHKCIHLIFFLDAFDFNPFGPAKGLYKTHGMYYTIGNLSPEFRSKVENILLAALLLDANLKQTEKEHLDGIDKFEESLGRLIKDLVELNSNGILMNKERFPVCFLFCTGDNLGAHQLGSFVQSFSSGHCCRICNISLTEFKNNPCQFKEFRTPQHYDESVLLAREKWEQLKTASITLQNRRREIQAQKKAAGQEVTKEVSNTMVSKSALKKLHAVNHEGIKPFPSVLNKIPGFHVCNNGLPSCLGHDIFEGVADIVLAKILEHFVETKQWFTLKTLNRRIKCFKYKGKDAADAPNEIKSFDSIKGHAVETWTLIRLLPFLIEDLVEDKEDLFWKLYLKLKEITEYVCAPKICKKQVAYLQTAISSYLSSVKTLLPECLTSKQHFLSHYPALILIYGPLIRLWTLRFESGHVFFKNVAKTCKSFKNILFTLAKKYQFRFAYDHLSGFIPPEIIYDSEPTVLNLEDLPTEVQQKLPPCGKEDKIKTVYDFVFKSIYYKNNQWMMLDKAGIMDISAGQIMKILVYPKDVVYFVLRVFTAEKSPNGYYVINEKDVSFKVVAAKDLPDFEPLPAYTNAENKLCISLKHSLVFMQN